MKNIYILNDTSDYHGGSSAVMEYLLALFNKNIFSVVLETCTNKIEITNINNADIVILNGEGTMHSSKPRAIHLLKVLEYAQNIGKSTIICNTSWFNMTREYDHVLRKLDQFTVREILSKKELASKHNIIPEIALDLSYHIQSNIVRNESIRFLKTDFYSNEFNCFVIPNGGNLEYIEFFNMKKHNWQETLQKFSSTKVLLTGRYHGLIASIKVKTRFITYPGNTKKIEGLLNWFGNDTALVNDYKMILSNVKSSHRNLNYYNDLFEWADNLKQWRPYFMEMDINVETIDNEIV